MKALSLQGWNDAGYRVLPGEKATGRNAQGEATFTRAQVDDLGNWEPPEPHPARARCPLLTEEDGVVDL